MEVGGEQSTDFGTSRGAIFIVADLIITLLYGRCTNIIWVVVYDKGS